MQHKYTIEQLMETVGCKKYPKRWAQFFDDAMVKYEEQGCVLAETKFYDELENKYHCFQEYKYAYERAAKETQKDEPLCRFLVLLAMALNDETHRQEDLKEFERPQVPQGKSKDAYEMVTGLAMCSQFHNIAHKLGEKGIPELYVCRVLQFAARGVRNYIWRHNGEIGFDLLWWTQKYMDGMLFPIGRLEIECYGVWEANGTIFVDPCGKYIAMADAKETDVDWVGYLYDSDGQVEKELSHLSKDTWNKVLEKGDPVVQIHIPADGPLKEEMVDETLLETKEFIAKYLPDFQYKAFACHSWMMSTKLDDMLDPNSNIVKFGRRFHRLICDGKGEDVFSFVFLKPNMSFELEELPENTTLEKKIKAHYRQGNVLYEMHGLFF